MENIQMRSETMKIRPAPPTILLTVYFLELQIEYNCFILNINKKKESVALKCKP